MPDKPSDLVQGTLDMLILKTLALEPMHGYGISVRIEQMSKGVFRLNAGSLFLAIQRLERDGLIDGEWKPTENNRRARYYTLAAGNVLWSHAGRICTIAFACSESLLVLPPWPSSRSRSASALTRPSSR